MNPVTDIVFSLTWVLLFAFAIRSIVKGWSMMSEDTARPNGMWTTKVTRPMHPEMKDVQPGEELMGVTFDQKTSCSLEEYQALQKRIEELKIELAMEEDEEDEDDGDIVVRT
ncbi:MAG: hypothetical protein VX805_03110 [Pseudomonadota bacterium]|nr:hypothetical protein [Pseudomonadota bacterium]